MSGRRDRAGEVRHDPDFVRIAHGHDLQHLGDAADVRQRRPREVDVALLDEWAELRSRPPFFAGRQGHGGQQPQLRNLRAELLLTDRVLDDERAVRLQQPADFHRFVKIEFLVQVDHPVAVGPDAVAHLCRRLRNQSDVRSRVERGAAGPSPAGGSSSGGATGARHDVAVHPEHAIAGRHRRGGAIPQAHGGGFCR